MQIKCWQEQAKTWEQGNHTMANKKNTEIISSAAAKKNFFFFKKKEQYDSFYVYQLHSLVYRVKIFQRRVHSLVSYLIPPCRAIQNSNGCRVQELGSRRTPWKASFHGATELQGHSQWSMPQCTSKVNSAV